MKLAIEISDPQAETLGERARRLGVQPEELAKATIADLLASSDEGFESAAAHVLKKKLASLVIQVWLRLAARAKR